MNAAEVRRRLKAAYRAGGIHAADAARRVIEAEQALELEQWEAGELAVDGPWSPFDLFDDPETIGDYA